MRNLDSILGAGDVTPRQKFVPSKETTRWGKKDRLSKAAFEELAIGLPLVGVGGPSTKKRRVVCSNARHSLQIKLLDLLNKVAALNLFRGEMTDWRF